MTIAFDHRPLRLRDSVILTLRSARLPATGTRAFVALVGSLAITAGTGGVFAMRLQATNAEVRADSIRLDQSASAAAPASHLLRSIGEIRALSNEIAEARTSGYRAADELARFGNAVPAHVWIARFRREGSELIVDGGAGSVDAVGRALIALNDDHARAELVGLKDGGRPGAPSEIRYSLRIDQR